MSDIQIVNCHIHTFTMRNVPRNFPNPLLACLKSKPRITNWVANCVPVLSDDLRTRLHRLARFQEEGNRGAQGEVLHDVICQYPGGTKFVVLPMDMELSGYGSAKDGIRIQHRDLYKLTREKKPLLPFATVHPDREDALDIIKEAIEEFGFFGLKIYPKLGYRPDHPRLMNEIYPYIIDHDLPVVTHCSRGGLKHAEWSQEQADAVTEPQAYDEVLTAFPEMRLCLAHFGGETEWDDYLLNGYDPDHSDEFMIRNWQYAIRKMIGSGEKKYQNLYTDISYTLFHFARYIPFLRLFLESGSPEAKLLRERVLFGSDFYMTKQEEMSEREVCFSLRNALGETTFEQIASTNPRNWLGKRAFPDL